jgi:hypothetical protein
MSTAIASRVDSNQIAIIQAAAGDCREALAMLKTSPEDLATGLSIAAAIRDLERALTPQIMAEIASLQGTSLGFKADKRYGPEELRAPVIEALVRGFRLVGNEMNVIAGNFYGAQAGFERKVTEFPGLTDLNLAYDVMEATNGVARVQCIATFRLRGEPKKWERQVENSDAGRFDNRIPIRVNSGMGLDAIIGKARRKFNAWIFDRLTGAAYPTPEGDMDGDDQPRRDMIPMFAGGPVKEENKPIDDGSPLLVSQYRAKFSAIAERAEIPKIMATAGRDASLTPEGKKAVAAMATEAGKIWPKKLDGGAAETDPPFNPPTEKEVAEHGGQQPPAGNGSKGTATLDDREVDFAVQGYVAQMQQAAEKRDSQELGRIKTCYGGDKRVQDDTSKSALKKAFNTALRTISG